ncbi:D-alanyl-D-alanine carboxypeptidase [Tamlana sedimentorum]|uniref:D-alanyl-D-alanine carboxypeptidase n=1 Tax=Neotamlana sedimentorum TaxID=1435349 RepID=A0A0D7WBX6_9FLAO|nr:D-alanyl-D-alanine carboxypeptidase [Tamlana sedimentorum]KJD36685.1 D-alanyl-D-alanine carboxypeptidase [Tamlana sedimentorum]
MFKKVVVFVFLLAGILSCKSVKLKKSIINKIEAPFYDNQFTGLLVVNAKNSDTVFSYNASKYFTPASNTKIFTLYSALQLLPTHIPAFKYKTEGDTITILGTGNPTFLHPFFNDSTVLKMAKNYKHVKLIYNNLDDEKFGPGWAWEDYDTYFSPERSSFPMYANVATISKTDSLQVTPEVLSQNVTEVFTSKRRNYNDNTFYYNKKNQDTIEVPLVIDSTLIKQLWQAIYPNKITFVKASNKPFDKVAYSNIASDSLYKRMMEVSDNFLAEQMLIMASSTLSDTLSSQKARTHILKHRLNDLKQEPRWVDGSGLSRYNLFTPTSFVQVLTKLYNDIPHERLFNLFPVGGKTGTLKRYYKGGNKPYIYAKSGTVGNNYSLSGYLITNSGETLIFSFMNNHYRKSTVEVKHHMESVFEWLRDNY